MKLSLPPTLPSHRISSLFALFLAGDTLDGLYISNPGQSQITEFVYLAFGKNITTFDAGMTAAASEFVLIGCNGAVGKKCNFSKASLPE